MKRFFVFIYIFMKHLKIFENHSSYSYLTNNQWDDILYDYIERGKFKDFSSRSKIERLLNRYGIEFKFDLISVHQIKRGVYYLPKLKVSLDIIEDDDWWLYVVYQPPIGKTKRYKCDNIEGIEQCLKDLKII